MSLHSHPPYSASEEKLNIITHALGLVMSFIAAGVLLVRAIRNSDHWQIAAVLVFGLSLILLYSASTAYHSSTDPIKRAKLRILDHVAIYGLIAGTYTPFALVSLHGSLGWIVFGTVWGIALIGAILKLLFTGRFKLLSTFLYIAMGWMGILLFQSLQSQLSTEGLVWMIAGGVAYSIGALLYSIKRLPYNHALFHVFVLIGSACHVITIYYFVLK